LEENQNTNKQLQLKETNPLDAQQSAEPTHSDTLPSVPTEIKQETPTPVLQPQTSPGSHRDHQPQTESMEVHKHPHHVTHKKKWGEYFLEFFMLFLAVFLGFVAENIREHNVEEERAKQMAKNLYKELYADSMALQKCINNRIIKEDDCKYFVAYTKDSNLTNLSPRFFPSFVSALVQIQYIIFEPNDGILNQLRNSGELRYFKSSELQSAIGTLGVKLAYVRSRNDKEYNYVEFYTRPFILKYLDFAWYEALTKQGSIPLAQALKNYSELPDHGKIMNASKFNRQEAESVASYYLLMLRSTRQIQYSEYAEACHNVLELLRKEYKINE
jgi:hypothetical protein